MPGDMADVVHIPIEACCAIQHSYSIYSYCMYGKAAKPKIRADELGVGLVASFFEASFEAAFNVGQNQLQIVTESRTPKVFLVEAILVLLPVVEGLR